MSDILGKSGGILLPGPEMKYAHIYRSRHLCQLCSVKFWKSASRAITSIICAARSSVPDGT